MTDAMRLNVKDSIERVMFLHKQLKAAFEFSPLDYVEGFTGTQIQIYDNESFENIREAYEISELAVKVEYWESGTMHKSFKLDGFIICVVIDKDEDGYIPQEGSNNG